MHTKIKGLMLVLLSAIACMLIVSCSASRKVNKQKAYIKNSYNAIKKEIPNADVTIVNDTIKVLFPNHLLFKSSSATINDAIEPTFVRFSKVLGKYKKTKILINGYTDNTGTSEVNLDLSQKRAESAKAKLIAYQVKESRLFAWGHGSKNPIADNQTEDGKTRNRRVEFIVVYDY
jgi:outer membrane protein OmpA-like peptidoglycan-associated protein